MIRAVFGGVVKDVGKEDTNGDSKLVKADDSSTNPLWGTLGLVHRDQSGNQTYTETSPHTTNDEERKFSCGGLHGDTDAKDET